MGGGVCYEYLDVTKGSPTNGASSYDNRLTSGLDSTDEEGTVTGSLQLENCGLSAPSRTGFVSRGGRRFLPS